jgi:hypothetical protein
MYSFDIDHKPHLAFFELGHVGLKLELKVRIIGPQEMARILDRSHDDRIIDEKPSVFAGDVEIECFDRGLHSCPYQLGRNRRIEEIARLQSHPGNLLRHCAAHVAAIFDIAILGTIFFLASLDELVAKRGRVADEGPLPRHLE